MTDKAQAREQWGTRLGLILAAAGNAVGIGNLLRFPTKAADSGGGAFIIPYIVSLLIFGIPVMWVIWWIGRYGGKFGHGSTPGMFDRVIPKRPAMKYLGVLGLSFPLVFCIYYTYIEAWMLGYAWFSISGDYTNVIDYATYLNEYTNQAVTSNYFPGHTAAVIAVLITLALNIFVLARGVTKGIETLAKIAMPLLFLFCLILAVRVLSIGTGPSKHSVFEGLAYVWSPNFSAITNPAIWLTAAGQIFFTLSIGFGSMECYASYLKEKDDVVLNGLTTSATNEFVEVIFGSVIAIPATVAFLGPDRVQGAGAFAIGMIAMPEILLGLQPLWFFGSIWFLLLFFAAFTSSVAVAQPIMAFMQDELKIPRVRAALILSAVWVAGTVVLVFFMKYGMLDQFDFWAGTVVLVVFSLIEVVMVAWFFGMDRFWEDIHRGADLPIPKVFYYVIKYVTPVALAGILVGWLIQEFTTDEMKNVNPKSSLLEGQEDIEKIRAKADLLYPSERGRQIKEEMARVKNQIEAAKASRDRARQESLEGKLTELESSWKEERGQLGKALIPLADREHGNVSVLADIDLDENGNVVRAVRVSASSDEAFEIVRKIVEQRTYKVTKYRDDRREVIPNWGWKGTFRIRMRFDALHVPPSTWIARAIMIGAFVVFAWLVHRAWKARGRTAGA